MKPEIADALERARNYSPCLDPGVAIVDREALDLILAAFPAPQRGPVIEIIDQGQRRPLPQVIISHCPRCGAFA